MARQQLFAIAGRLAAPSVLPRRLCNALCVVSTVETARVPHVQSLRRSFSRLAPAMSTPSSGGPNPLTSILQGGYNHPLLRNLQAERNLTRDMLMYPIFVTDEPDAEVEIPSLPGQKRWGVNRLESFLKPLVEKGLKSVILFGVPLNAEKDGRGTPADDPQGPVISAIRLLRRVFPELYVAADVCLCEYTSHGHCGLLLPTCSGPSHPVAPPSPAQKASGGVIDNTKSVERLVGVALAYAEAGAHCVAPSDMMDGRIGAIKKALIERGWGNSVCLMSYSAKFASGLYGPFRDAAGSVPGFGNRKCYQLPPNARGLAHRAILRDVSEGADVIMVKPGLPYLDIVSAASTTLAPHHPLAVYQVSGEYAMIIAGAEKGVYALREMVEETLGAYLRSGATLVLTYFTPQILEWMDEGRAAKGAEQAS